jgi:hypothetical protein
MGKKGGRSLNPADAYRKEQRKKASPTPARG